MLDKLKKSLMVGSSVVAALCLAASISSAEDTKLRIQTHFAPEQLSGKQATEFIENILQGTVQVRQGLQRCEAVPQYALDARPGSQGVQTDSRLVDGDKKPSDSPPVFWKH